MLDGVCLGGDSYCTAGMRPVPAALSSQLSEGCKATIQLPYVRFPPAAVGLSLWRGCSWMALEALWV